MPTPKHVSPVDPQIIAELNANRNSDGLCFKDPMTILIAYEDGKKLGVIEWYESFEEWLARTQQE